MGFQSSACEPVPLPKGSSEYHISTWPLGSMAEWMATTLVVKGALHDPVPCCVWTFVWFFSVVVAARPVPVPGLSPRISKVSVATAPSSDSRHQIRFDLPIIAVSIPFIKTLRPLLVQLLIQTLSAGRVRVIRNGRTGR